MIHNDETDTVVSFDWKEEESDDDVTAMDFDDTDTMVDGLPPALLYRQSGRIEDIIRNVVGTADEFVASQQHFIQYTLPNHPVIPPFMNQSHVINLDVTIQEDKKKFVIAARHANLPKMKEIKAKYTSRQHILQLINATDDYHDDGTTALHYACEDGVTSIVEFLIEDCEMTYINRKNGVSKQFLSDTI